MAGSELTDLTETTTPALTDILYIVVDPAGTPLDRKVTRGNVLGADLQDLITRWTPASTAGAASLDFLEDADNGTNKATLISPATLGSDIILTLPSATGTLVTTADIADAVQFSQPTQASTRASATLGALNNAWTDTVTTTADRPRVRYNLSLSGQANGDTLVMCALTCAGTIMDRGAGYLGGTNRETRVNLAGIHNPGAANTYTYEVFVGSLGAETITVNSTIDTSTATSLTADGVSSLQLQAVAVA